MAVLAEGRPQPSLSDNRGNYSGLDKAGAVGRIQNTGQIRRSAFGITGSLAFQCIRCPVDFV